MFKAVKIGKRIDNGFVVGPDGHHFTAFKLVPEYIFEYIKDKLIDKR